MNAVVIGAGPSGLACAACLRKNGIEATIFEATDRIAPAWHNHYDSLYLHTTRGRSGLPYMAMPSEFGRYPSRAQVIAYLEDYANALDLRPVFNSPVETVRPDGPRWSVAHAGGTQTADAVIFATGLNGTPHRPDIPCLPEFPGQTLHSSGYRNPDPFTGQSVLVIGFGNSGGDIALDLARAGIRVAMSVRGPVNILPQELFGIPITSLGGLRKILPYTWADALTAPILRAKIGKPENYGLQGAGKGPAAQVIEDGRVPLIDIGTLAAIKSGKISVFPGPERIENRTVRFADGQAADFDTIILATGYRADLRPLLPDNTAVLTETGQPTRSGAPGPVPGLYFCSYIASADGQLRQSGIEARAIATDIAARRI